MIQLYNVTKAYSRDSIALDDVSLSVDRGSFVFITGPSGAGKTTLLRLLTREERPTRGQLVVGGKNLTRMRESMVPYFRRKIGVVFQDFKLLNDRTIDENIQLPLQIQGYTREELRRRCMNALLLVGLTGKRNAMPLELSGGEQQRVAIARAVIHQPVLLIADEPTGNLDPEMSLEIMHILEDINAGGTTVLVATHDIDMVRRMGKPHIHLQNGQVHVIRDRAGRGT